MNRNFIGTIYLLITAIIWGATFVTQYLGGQILSSLSFLFYRTLFGCIFLFIVILITNFKRTHKLCFYRKDENENKTNKLSIYCGTTLFFAMFLQQRGIELTETAKSGLIASLEVITVPIILAMFYKRKIKPLTWFFIFIAMVGMMLLSLESTSGINFGDFLNFVSMILFSITIIQVEKYVTSDVDPIKFTFLRFVVVLFLSFIFAAIFKNDLFHTFKIKKALFSIIFSGVFSSGIAYTFQTIGQKYTEAIIATIIMGLEGVFAAIFGVIFLSQNLNIVQVIGIIVAFLSTVFVQISNNR